MMAKDAGITRVAAGKAFESFLEYVTHGLKKRGRKVTLVGFGTFKKMYQKTLWGSSPQTGEKIRIKVSNTVFFKPGKALRDQI